MLFVVVLETVMWQNCHSSCVVGIVSVDKLSPFWSLNLSSESELEERGKKYDDSMAENEESITITLA